MKVLFLVLSLAGLSTTALAAEVVAEVNESGNSNPVQLHVHDGSLYFVAEDTPFSVRSLWRFDPASGLPPVKLAQDPTWLFNDSSRHPRFLTSAGGRVLFMAYSTTTGYALWATDGTPAGTGIIADPDPQTASGFLDGTNHASIAGVFTFGVNDGVHGLELWRSDGTTEGTRLVVDAIPGTPSLNPRYMTEVGDRTFLSGFIYNAGGGFAGTRTYTLDIVADTVALAGEGLAPLDFEPVAIRPFGPVTEALGDGEEEPSPRAIVWGSGKGLYNTDGTLGGTLQLASLTGTMNGHGLEIGGDGAIWFFNSTAAAGKELWRSDGTPEGTSMVADIRLGSNPGIPAAGLSALVPRGPGVCFVGQTDSLDREPWCSDGTEEGTKRLADINPGPSGSDPAWLTPVGDVLAFVATAGADRELYLHAPGSDVVKVDLNPASSSDPDNLVLLDGTLFLVATVPGHGRELLRVVLPTGCAFQPDEPCDTGNPCDEKGVCIGGTCTSTSPVDCDDLNPCTDDACIDPLGCTHVPNSAPCFDGDLCTGPDLCVEGACQTLGFKSCDDLIFCTTDACVEGDCVHTPNDAACADPAAGPCVEPLCVADVGCNHAPITGPCDDGKACTEPDTCDGPVCTGPSICLDIPCHLTSCNEAGTCDYKQQKPGSDCATPGMVGGCDEEASCVASSDLVLIQMNVNRYMVALGARAYIPFRVRFKGPTPALSVQVSASSNLPLNDAYITFGTQSKPCDSKTCLSDSVAMPHDGQPWSDDYDGYYLEGQIDFQVTELAVYKVKIETFSENRDFNLGKSDNDFEAEVEALYQPVLFLDVIPDEYHRDVLPKEHAFTVVGIQNPGDLDLKVILEAQAPPDSEVDFPLPDCYGLEPWIARCEVMIPAKSPTLILPLLASGEMTGPHGVTISALDLAIPDLPDGTPYDKSQIKPAHFYFNVSNPAAKLGISATKPPDVDIGELAEFMVTVENLGLEPIDNVSLHFDSYGAWEVHDRSYLGPLTFDHLDLDCKPAPKPVCNLPMLYPGVSIDIPFGFIGSEAGNGQLVFEASAPGVDSASTTVEVTTLDLCYKKNDGEWCDDGNYCTEDDKCNNLVCQGTPVGDCAKSPCAIGVCDKTCVVTLLPDQSYCVKPDGEAGHCMNGECIKERLVLEVTGPDLNTTVPVGKLTTATVTLENVGAVPVSVVLAVVADNPSNDIFFSFAGVSVPCPGQVCTTKEGVLMPGTTLEGTLEILVGKPEEYPFTVSVSSTLVENPPPFDFKITGALIYGFSLTAEPTKHVDLEPFQYGESLLTVTSIGQLRACPKIRVSYSAGLQPGWGSGPFYPHTYQKEIIADGPCMNPGESATWVVAGRGPSGHHSIEVEVTSTPVQVEGVTFKKGTQYKKVLVFPGNSDIKEVRELLTVVETPMMEYSDDETISLHVKGEVVNPPMPAELNVDLVLPGPVSLDSDFSMSLLIGNKGDTPVPDVAVEVTPSPGLTVETSSSDGVCEGSICALGELGAGEVATATVTGVADTVGQASVKAVVTSGGIVVTSKTALIDVVAACKLPSDDGKPCDDGDPCTKGDVCAPEGGCKGTATFCPGAGACNVGKCSPETGACEVVAASDGSSCAGDPCMICQSGACLPKVCEPSSAAAMNPCLSTTCTGGECVDAPKEGSCGGPGQCQDGECLCPQSVAAAKDECLVTSLVGGMCADVLRTGEPCAGAAPCQKDPVCVASGSGAACVGTPVTSGTLNGVDCGPPPTPIDVVGSAGGDGTFTALPGEPVVVFDLDVTAPAGLPLTLVGVSVVGKAKVTGMETTNVVGDAFEPEAEVATFTSGKATMLETAKALVQPSLVPVAGSSGSPTGTSYQSTFKLQTPIVLPSGSTTTVQGTATPTAAALLLGGGVIVGRRGGPTEGTRSGGSGSPWPPWSAVTMALATLALLAARRVAGGLIAALVVGLLALSCGSGDATDSGGGGHAGKDATDDALADTEGEPGTDASGPWDAVGDTADVSGGSLDDAVGDTVADTGGEPLSDVIGDGAGDATVEPSADAATDSGGDAGPIPGPIEIVIEVTALHFETLDGEPLDVEVSIQGPTVRIVPP